MLVLYSPKQFLELFNMLLIVLLLLLPCVSNTVLEEHISILLHSLVDLVTRQTKKQLMEQLFLNKHQVA